MGNGGVAMEHDQCIMYGYCKFADKAWCRDTKILKQSKTSCIIFEQLIIEFRNYLIHKRGWKILK